MTLLYTALILLVCALIFINISRQWNVHNIHRRAKLPANKKATMFDVRHLLMEGEKDLAIQLYCQIFHTNAARAKKDIEELERSLKV